MHCCRKLTILSALALVAMLAAITQAQAFNNDCSLGFKGSYRKAVKNRKAADGANYTNHNNGAAITVAKWFGLACGFDSKVKGKKITTSTKVINGVETVKVTLEGFLLGAKFERHKSQGDGKDNDFHIEISDSKKWKSKHLIVEVPPGAEYCDARKEIFDIVKADGCGVDRCILKTPVKIRVTGFVFLDSAHGKTCKIRRGMVVGGVTGAEGAWEIHPVLKVERVQ
jgi:hypothetical protein